jgi:hypothetical protein
MIEIKTMTSITIEECVAINFAEEKVVEGDNKHCVLCILECPDVCYTAIDLNIGKPITKYAYKQEILLLPGTLFEVRAVTNGPKTVWYTIRLENVPVPRDILMEALNEL